MTGPFYCLLKERVFLLSMCFKKGVGDGNARYGGGDSSLVVNLGERGCFPS